MLCVATVQEGLVPDDRRARLGADLGAILRDSFGPDTESQVVWIEVAPGSGYSAGAPSTSSVVGVLVPDGTEPSVREPLMRAVTDAWMRVTGCTDHEIVVSAVDERALTASS